MTVHENEMLPNSVSRGGKTRAAIAAAPETPIPQDSIGYRAEEEAPAIFTPITSSHRSTSCRSARQVRSIRATLQKMTRETVGLEIETGFDGDIGQFVTHP